MARAPNWPGWSAGYQFELVRTPPQVLEKGPDPLARLGHAPLQHHLAPGEDILGGGLGQAEGQVDHPHQLHADQGIAGHILGGHHHAGLAEAFEADLHGQRRRPGPGQWVTPPAAGQAKKANGEDDEGVC